MDTYQLLDNINSPADLKCLSDEEMVSLAEEIRSFMTDSVSKTGGHLASNLGIVETTLALHRVYDFSHDRLVFDVGHQCYVHKIITGRRSTFNTLRQKNGITGFPNPKESVFDPFVVGHASTSISSALGLACAYRIRGENHKVVAVVGDGSIGGGMCFEAMNNAGHAQEDLVVILNDNDMSISETVGSFASYLTDIRSRPITQKLREDIHHLLKNIPIIGTTLDWAQEHALDAVKGIIEAGHIFSAMGFKYYGPIDGHDISMLEQELTKLKQLPGPKLLHVITGKGQGFPAALADPEAYHSAVPFEIHGSGQVVPKKGKKKGYTSVFMESLLVRAKADDRIVAITAAMPTGTGIKQFGESFPDRFIDVGICEAHSVTFAAGLARAGLKPILAIYSTFLQRGYDQIVHDVAVQSDLPIIFALDRAGLVGADGPTHHGVFDIAFLRHIPGMTLMAPRNGAELPKMLDFALSCNTPVAIRYPRGSLPGHPIPVPNTPIQQGKAERLRIGKDGSIFAYGRMVEPSYLAAEKLAEEGIELTVYNARFAKPVDEEAIAREAKNTSHIFTVEDHVLSCGFGSAIAEAIMDLGINCSLTRIGLPDAFVEHGTVEELDAIFGLNIEGIGATIRNKLRT